MLRRRRQLLNGGSLPFSPSDIAGLAAWYDPSNAGSISQTAGSVDQINDLSGNARHLLATTTQRPTTGTHTSTRGKNVLAFNGSSNYMQTNGTFSLNQPNTVFVVAKALATTDGSTIFTGKLAFSGENLLRISTTKFAIYAGLEVFGGTTVNSSQNIHTCLFNGSSSSYLLNGVSDGVGDAFINFLSPGITIGARTGGTANWNGDIGEVIVYNALLTAGQINQVGNYLSAKW